MSCCSKSLKNITIVNGTPTTVTDTSSVDLTATGSNISADVVVDPNGGLQVLPTGVSTLTQCEVTSDSGGLKLDDGFYDQVVAVPAANIEGKVDLANTSTLGQVDSSKVIEALTVRDNCKLKVYVPTEHTSVTGTVAINGVGFVNVSGVYSQNVNFVTITNPSQSRSMAFTLAPSSMTISVDNIGTNTASCIWQIYEPFIGAWFDVYSLVASGTGGHRTAYAIRSGILAPGASITFGGRFNVNIIGVASATMGTAGFTFIGSTI